MTTQQYVVDGAAVDEKQIPPAKKRPAGWHRGHFVGELVARSCVAPTALGIRFWGFPGVPAWANLCRASGAGTRWGAGL